MRIDEVELRVDPAAVQERRSRRRSAPRPRRSPCIATVRSDGVEGYGEGVMELLPLYREETIAGALRPAARRVGARRCCARLRRTRPTCATAGRGGAATRWPRRALELAVWDCYARQQDVPLRTLLGGERTEIPVGASLGMNPVRETVASVDRHVAEGYRRVKLKIEPGWDRRCSRRCAPQYPNIELTVDANSAYTLDDIDPAAASTSSACTTSSSRCTGTTSSTTPRSPRQLRTPICLDETLTSPARVTRRARPGRVHGRQRQGRPVRGLTRCEAGPRPVRRAGRADVVRRDARDRDRPGPQHPSGHDARLRLPGRHGVGQPHLRPRHHRAAARGQRTASCRCPPGRGSASRSTGRSSTGHRERRGPPLTARVTTRVPRADAPRPSWRVLPGVREADLGRRRERCRSTCWSRRSARAAWRSARSTATALVGAVYGFATAEPHVLHSHYMAVDPEYRRRGARCGAEAAPARVVPGNGHHARPLDVRPAAARQRAPQPALPRRGRHQYHVDHYGVLGGINGALPSDRVTVLWDLLGRATQWPANGRGRRPTGHRRRHRGGRPVAHAGPPGGA